MMRKICLLLCIVLLVSCQSTDAPTVSVTGSASVETHPDTLSFTLSAVYTGITTEEARSVTSGMIGYSTALLRDSFDVLEEDIHTEFFSISPSYTYKDGEEILNGLLKELLEKINQLGIGPQGFGGETTALGVQIETYPTHIAGMPVAVNINCHVTRHKEAVL